MEIKELESIAAQVRRDIIRMVHGAQSGHPGGSLGCADFMTALYFEIMNIHPEAFAQDGAGEDMFFLSNGHISPLLYSVMFQSSPPSASCTPAFKAIPRPWRAFPVSVWLPAP